MYRILGVCGGNGVAIHPFNSLNLLGNIEPRAIFKTPNDIQWNCNFDLPLYNNLTSDFKNVDVIVGAPDCGHSSVLSYSRAKKLGNPKENKSLSIFLKSLDTYKPKVFMMENLPKLIEGYPELKRYLLKNYNVIKINDSVSRWGNSQMSRKRLILVGFHKDFDISPIKRQMRLEFELISREYLLNSGELIGGLEKLDEALCNVRESDEYQIPLYYGNQRKMTTLQAKNIWMGEFSSESRWPVNMERMKHQPGVYRNFQLELPKTVRKQSRQFNHRGEMLTPREMARIQGVPDHFKLWYDKSRHLYCINKARATVTKTPPYEIGLWFYNLLINLNLN